MYSRFHTSSVWHFDAAYASVSVRCFHWNNRINIHTHSNVPMKIIQSIHYYYDEEIAAPIRMQTQKYLHFQSCIFVLALSFAQWLQTFLYVFPSMKSSIGLSSYATAVIIGSKNYQKKKNTRNTNSSKFVSESSNKTQKVNNICLSIW